MKDVDLKVSSRLLHSSRRKLTVQEIYSHVRDLENFEKWWIFYTDTAKKLDAKPGSKAEAAHSWMVLELEDTDFNEVWEGTRLDVDRRIRDNCKFLPHGCRFLHKRFWETALKVKSTNMTIVSKNEQFEPISLGYSQFAEAPFRWKNLEFRSEIEVLIAEALDNAKVLFFPNAKCRISDRAKNKEVDFLVCLDGKWGILEVDGSTHKGCAADDHSRDRMFMRHGIKLIQRYTAEECRMDAKAVVDEFLGFLQRM